MDAINYLYAVILGIVEGLTEFLPISSTGHLILAKDMLGFNLPSANMFIVVIQLGAILAVCWLYRIKLFDVAFHLNKKPQQMFVAKLFVAFLPAAVIGLAFHNLIEEYLFFPLVVAVSLIVGGLIIWLVERRIKPQAKTHDIESMSIKQAFLVGCAQVFSMVPGTSRSGATIIGGMLFGLDRKIATEFSFFLAIPVMVGATILDVYKYYGSLSIEEIYVLIVGFVVSFLSAIGAIKFLIAYVAHHDFMIFAWYRIIFGTAMLVFYLV